jgi:hypothetical protein
LKTDHSKRALNLDVLQWFDGNFVKRLIAVSVLIGVANLSFPAQGSKNTTCKINDNDWTHFEKVTWSQICSKGYAALNGAPIRASFIRDIIVEKPYGDTTKINGIVIDNAVITGDLDLAGMTFDGALSITNSVVRRNVNLNDGKFGKTVSFVGTHLLQGLLASI